MRDAPIVSDALVDVSVVGGQPIRVSIRWLALTMSLAGLTLTDLTWPG